VRAGDDVYDFVIGPPGDCIGNLAQGGKFVDLMTLEAMHTENEWWSQSMNASMNHEGKLYAAAGPIALCYLYSPYAFFVNLTMNARFDLADPYQLVEDGTWTVEVMADMMKEAAVDLNNDGVMSDADQFGLTTTAEAGKAFYLGCGKEFAASPLLARIDRNSAALLVGEVIESAVSVACAVYRSRHSLVGSRREEKSALRCGGIIIHARVGKVTAYSVHKIPFVGDIVTVLVDRARVSEIHSAAR
jgi:hypothetical protein